MLNSLTAAIHKNNVIRLVTAKRLCTPALYRWRSQLKLQPTLYSRSYAVV